MKRFFVQNQIQDLSQDLVLSGVEHNHLAHVLRLRVGDEVIIVCGDEFDYYYEITSITRSQTNLTLIKKELNKSNPLQIVTVYMA